jgi:hypothetical protein
LLWSGRVLPLKISFRFLVLFVAVGLFAGCASKDSVTPRPTEDGRPPVPWSARLLGWTSVFGKIFPKKERPPRAIEPVSVGIVRQVNVENRFVLMDSTSAATAPVGGELIAVSGERQTAVLRMTELRSASFFIADILAGTPTVGDRIFRSLSSPEPTE